MAETVRRARWLRAQLDPCSDLIAAGPEFYAEQLAHVVGSVQPVLAESCGAAVSSTSSSARGRWHPQAARGRGSIHQSSLQGSGCWFPADRAALASLFGGFSSIRRTMAGPWASASISRTTCPAATVDVGAVTAPYAAAPVVRARRDLGADHCGWRSCRSVRRAQTIERNIAGYDSGQRVRAAATLSFITGVFDVSQPVQRGELRCDACVHIRIIDVTRRAR